MKKKIFSVVLGVLVLASITGCGNKTGDSNIDGNSNTKGNCIVTECIQKIKPESTVSEINSIIGFEGELTDEKYNKYYWELSEDTGIEVTYYSSDKGTISIDFNRDSVANKKVDFSRYDELQPKIKDGITYQDFITYIGNVDGVLIEKSSYSNKYVWVAEDGSYLDGSFSTSSNKCTFASGRIK